MIGVTRALHTIDLTSSHRHAITDVLEMLAKHHFMSSTLQRAGAVKGSQL